MVVEMNVGLCGSDRRGEDDDIIYLLSMSLWKNAFFCIDLVTAYLRTLCNALGILHPTKSLFTSQAGILYGPPGYI